MRAVAKLRAAGTAVKGFDQRLHEAREEAYRE